ncbi:DNA polymerase epsilon subunit 3 [Schistosoma japonicum]|uniref:DNA polymerase epsilon subunit 3 n=1 Tax=Schistosoma japonicum TaxID=6182 RepID=A0A4Z2CV23_SCHJA|nr:DNA polymerase epsilon subunit 3 [Schistosoma japonicum]
MAEKAEDLYLPNAVLLRIIRESLPERTLVSREARSAISKSASSFILYVTSLASVHSEKAKRKTLTGNDILAALKEMEFDHFIPALKEFLDKYREQVVAKKTTKRMQNESEEDTSVNKLPKIASTSSTSNSKFLDNDPKVVDSLDVDDNSIVAEDDDEEDEKEQEAEEEENENVDVEVANEEAKAVNTTHPEVDDITEQHDYIHGDSSDDSNDSSLSTEALNENLESFVL